MIWNPVYGYQAVNVESQRRSEHSPLNWMKSLIQTRNLFQVFSRGSIEFLDPSNHRVLAYVRQLGGGKVLVVNNLSSSAQAEGVNLQARKGPNPTEMFGGELFPRIGELRQLLNVVNIQVRLVSWR